MSEDKHTPSMEDDGQEVIEARKRVKGFGTHLLAYFGLMIVLVPLNFWLAPDQVWFILPLIGWGSVLAVHAAYALGLFKVFKK